MIGAELLGVADVRSPGLRGDIAAVHEAANGSKPNGALSKTSSIFFPLYTHCRLSCN